MIEGKTITAIIGAREGSRRAPLKNITLFRGKPLLEHAIDHAQASRYIDQVAIFSSDPAALRYAEPPIIKIPSPPFLATPHTTAEAYIAYCLYNLPEHLVLPDYFVLLQPTSPLRTPHDIDACIERAHHHSGQCISYNEHGKRNGAVYVSAVHKFLSLLSLADPTHGHDLYTMPNSRSLDIDYPQDFFEKASQSA